MDRNDEYQDGQDGGFKGRTFLPPKTNSNNPRCLADGVIPWMADHIELVAIDKIKPSPNVVRKHSKRQRRLLEKGLGEFGFTTPLLVDQDFTLILGDARLQAATAVGMDVVPVIRVSHLTDRQIKALTLADNRIAELAQWDSDALARVLEEMCALDFDIELTGFTVTEADLVIARHLPKPHDVAVDDCPPVRPGVPIALMGDIFALDEHRVGCGDCRDPDFVTRLMSGTSAAASFSDAPYNVPIVGNVSGLGKVKHGEFVMGSGEMNDDEFFAFLVAYLHALIRVSSKGAVHFSCMDWRSLDILVRAIRHVGGTILNICTWAKTNPGMGSFYRSQIEFVVVFKFGDAKHRNNVELGVNGRNRSNWPVPGFEDTELGVFMEPEVGYGATEVYA